MLENDWKFGWGIEYFSQNSLAKILLPSSLAALKFGPKTLIFLFSKKSRFPYFEKLDRVIFFDDKLNWIGDTRSIPSSLLLIEELNEQSSENNFNNQENKNETIFYEDLNLSLIHI